MERHQRKGLLLMSDKDVHDVITTKLDEILKILNGNGKVGLCAKVTIMWTWGVVILGVVGTTFIKTFFF